MCRKLSFISQNGPAKDAGIGRPVAKDKGLLYQWFREKKQFAADGPRTGLVDGKRLGSGSPSRAKTQHDAFIGELQCFSRSPGRDSAC